MSAWRFLPHGVCRRRCPQTLQKLSWGCTQLRHSGQCLGLPELALCACSMPGRIGNFQHRMTWRSPERKYRLLRRYRARSLRWCSSC